MKKITLILIVLSLSLTRIYAQSAKDEIRQTFENYATAFSNNDFERAIDYIHPMFFETHSKDFVIEQLYLTFVDTIQGIKLDRIQIDEISKVRKYKKKKYATVAVTYVFAIKIKEMRNIFGAPESDIPIMLKFLESQYGEKNVRHNKELKQFEMIVLGTFYAIKASTLKGWKWFEKDYDTNAIQKIIPEKVLKKL